MNRFRKTATALAVTAAATVALAAPADANIGATKWARGTIFVQNMSSTDTIGTADYNYAVNYLRSLHDTQGVNWDIEPAACRTGSPCVHFMVGNWGATGWSGLTSPAATCSAGVRCSWDGSAGNADHTSSYWTLIQINKYYAGSTTYNDSVACHEFGHGVPELQHASGSTCMQATPGSYTTFQQSEVDEIRTKFAGITR